MNILLLNRQLESLRNFLSFVGEGAGKEWDLIEEQRLSGKYEDFEDYDAVSDRPFILVNLASRAVAYELTALIEGELHSLANTPWAKSKGQKGPKIFNDLGQFIPDEMRNLKLVSDLPFKEIIQLVETRIGIKLSEIEEWEQIRKLRETVNAFKHRRGFRHPRETEISDGKISFMERHQISQDDAFESITVVGKFFRNLYLASQEKPSIR
jgi:hypothetical protein